MGIYATLHKMVNNPKTTANAVTIDQITTFSPSPGLTRLLRSAGGELDGTFAAVRQVDPRWAFSTTDVATFLAENSSKSLYNGLKIDSDVTYEGLRAYFKQRAAGGAFTGAGANIMMTVGDGLILVDDISVNGKEDAVLSGRVIPVSPDGSDAPIAIAADEDLPAGDPVVSNVYGMGPVVVNNSEVGYVQSVRLAMNIQEIVRGNGASIYNTFAAVGPRTPVILVDTLDADWLVTLDVLGSLQATSLTYFYLRKREAGGAFYADNTSNHIKVLMVSSQHVIMELPDDNGDLKPQIAIVPVKSGANDIFTVTTGVAITVP